mgnify:CR=1 FL=1
MLEFLLGACFFLCIFAPFTFVTVSYTHLTLPTNSLV